MSDEGRQRGSVGNIGIEKGLTNAPRMGAILKTTGETISRRQAVVLKAMGCRATSRSATTCASVTQKSQLGGIIRIPRTQVYEERARALNQKFGLEIKPSRWQVADGEVLRVEKPVRVRIHRECHMCHASFGASKECLHCKHQRCDECTRDPPKRAETLGKDGPQIREKQSQDAGQPPKSTPSIYGSLEQIRHMLLTRPSRMEGADLVFKKPRMRIRRYCHVCTVQFMSDMRVCEGCGHRRCADCIRTPASKHHGEAAESPSLSLFECHECRQLFPQGAKDGMACPNCQHKKCSACPRTKPKRVVPDPGPDPEELGGLLNRLKGVNLEKT